MADGSLRGPRWARSGSPRRLRSARPSPLCSSTSSIMYNVTILKTESLHILREDAKEIYLSGFSKIVLFSKSKRSIDMRKKTLKKLFFMCPLNSFSGFGGGSDFSGHVH